MIPLKLPLLIFLIAVLPAILGQQCYKKCSCFRNSHFKKSTLCKRSLKYLDIHIDQSGVTINCKNVNHLMVPNIISFDAGYLTKIDDLSPLTMTEMIHKCQKTRYGTIKYSMDVGRVQRIILSSQLLTLYPNISYLSIDNNLYLNKNNILNIEHDFLVNMKELKSLSLTQFNNIKTNFLQLPPTLESINLSSNNLETLEDIFNTTKNLKIVNLNNNIILQLTKSHLENLKNITYMDLSQNQINNIGIDVFSNIHNLTYLNISFNNLHDIDNEIFLNLTRLETLDLSKNEDIKLPETIFKSLRQLKWLDLSGCNLKDLPRNLLGDTLNLRYLNISKNFLTSIENKTFGKLKLLNTLDLSFNELTFLSDGIFVNLTSIRKIYINNNRMIKLNMQSFPVAGSLDILNAANNVIEKIEVSSTRLKINELILRDNKIDTVFFDILYGNIFTLDLSQNNIDEIILNRSMIPNNINLTINLSENQIKNFDVIGKAPKGYNWSIYLDTRKNYIQCNCKTFGVDFIDRFLSDATFNVDPEQTICEKPKCPVFKIRNCPLECSCSYKLNDTSIVVDCSSRNLTKYPVVSPLTIDNIRYKYNQTILLLNDNYLNLEGQELLQNYENITVLDLSNNKLTDVKWIPPHIVELNLMGNELKTLGKLVTDRLRLNNNLDKIHLANNYWICDETARHLQSFLIEFNNIKVNKSEVRCNDTGEYLVYTNVHPQQTNVVKMVILITVASILLALLSALMMYYKYGNAIKVYLYSKNICLWCVAEEELDKEKEYDIFISYSHKDESFVQNELLKELESGDAPFKICIHYRDWFPGEFISKQIVESVLNSRRTLVILSNNFMESVWGKMEFRTAHTQAISEGRARVVVVLYGDLNEDSLDNEMKTYLKTNTYVKWGDPWFWNKLKYALPHSKNKISEPS